MTDPRQIWQPGRQRPGQQGPGGSGGRLAVIQLVMASLHSLWLCRDDALRLGIIPVLLYFGGLFYGEQAMQAVVDAMATVQQAGQQAVVKPDLSLAINVLLTGFIMFASLGLLAVNWLRFLLLGPQAASGLGVTLGRHHLMFVLGALALMFTTLLGLSLLSLPISRLLQGATVYGIWIAALVVGAVAIRLGLVLVALAINQPLGLRQAWDASRGQGIVLLIAFLLVEAPFVILVIAIGLIAGITHLDVATPYTLMLIESLVQVAATMAQCGVLAAAYRRLIGVRA